MASCSEKKTEFSSVVVQVIVDHGLGEKAENDFRLVRDCCSALLKMTPTKLKPDDPDCQLNFGLDHHVFVRLEKLLQ